MKKAVRRGALVALLLAALPASSAIVVTDLAEPVSIAGSWKFRTGDDTAWAAPELDDGGWQSTQVPAHAPEGLAGYSGMLWYRLTLQLDLSVPSVRDTTGALAVSIGNVMSAYEIYAGGERLGGMGRLPPTPVARYDQHATWPIPASALGPDGKLVLAMRVWRNPAVSEHWETGPNSGDFLLGNVGDLRADMLRKAIVPDLILAALYLVLGLYHLLIASRNRALKEFFWFGLFSVVLAGYTFETSQSKFFLDLPYFWHKKIEYLLLFAAPVLFGITLCSVTRTPINKLIFGFNVVFGLYFLTALVAPGDAILSLTLKSYQYLVAIWALVMAAVMALRAYRGSRAARGVVALLLLLVAAVINDTLLETALVGSGNVLYIVFAIMLFFMALMMAERYTEILRKLESSVEKRTAELVEANRELAVAAEAKGNFLANMSHEMRTPMNAILGLTRLGLKTELTEQQRDYFSKVEKSAEGLQDIIGSILDFSKLADGELECVSEPFSPVALVDSIERNWESPMREAGLELTSEVDPDIPETLIGDVRHLKQVLSNFMSNALKFTEQGAVSLSVAMLERGEESVRVRFAVSDTGIGIADDKRDKLFEAFSQADNSMTREYGGTGLGLSIAGRLVELMGGSIDVESTPGAGSTFSFDLRLPVAAPDRRAEAEPAEIDLAPIYGARVLLVDDSELNLQVAGELLKQAKLYVDLARNGREAVEKASSAQFDCVLMDVQMPVMDGYSATERIHSKPHLKDLPVVAMTANAMQQDRERGAEAGMVAYIPKPIDPNELYRTLLHWIEPGERAFDERSFATPALSDGTLSDLPESLPGIDISDGLKRVGGNAALYLGLLRDLVLDYADSAERLRAMLDDNDTDAARQFAHKLRGIANNLGAGELGAAAEAIELPLKEGAAAAPDALPRLSAALDEVKDSVAALLPLMEQDDETAGLDQEQCAALISEASRAVEENDPQALDIVAKLLAGIPEDRGGHGELAAASEALDMYDFAAAGTHLEAAIEAGLTEGS